jgi:VanZ family protein
MQLLDRILKPLFWAALIFAYVAAIVPGKEAPAIWTWDKANHMAAFFTLSMLFALGWRRTPLARIALILAAFGAAIEISQMIPMLHRDAEFADWVADVAATVVGLLFAALLRGPLSRAVREQG